MLVNMVLVSGTPVGSAHDGCLESNKPEHCTMPVKMKPVAIKAEQVCFSAKLFAVQLVFV